MRNVIETKNTTNYLIDWNSSQDRINYFRNLRKFLSEVDAVGDRYPTTVGAFIDDVFKRWNVYFIDADEIPRVNLDEPREA